MRVELEPGEKVDVGFKDSDGVIEVRFGAAAITVSADLEDTAGRVGVIYEERFGEGIPVPDDEIDPLVELDPNGKPVITLPKPDSMELLRSLVKGSVADLVCTLADRLAAGDFEPVSMAALMNQLAEKLGLEHASWGGYRGADELGDPPPRSQEEQRKLSVQREHDERNERAAAREHDGEVGTRAALLMREVVCEQVYRARESWNVEHPVRALDLRKLDPNMVSLASIILVENGTVEIFTDVATLRLIAADIIDGKMPEPLPEF